MEIKLSSELKTVLRYARDEAMRTGSYGIGPDHLMLAILRNEDNGACRTLAGTGIDTADFKEKIDAAVFKEDPVPYFDMERVLPTHSAGAVLEMSAYEVLKIGGHEIMTPHLLLALSLTEGNATSEYLISKDVGYDKLNRYMRSNDILVPRQPENIVKIKDIAGVLGEQLTNILGGLDSMTNIYS